MCPDGRLLAVGTLATGGLSRSWHFVGLIRVTYLASSDQFSVGRGENIKKTVSQESSPDHFGLVITTIIV